MGKYGQAAVEAAKLLISKVITEPAVAWDIATNKIFGKGTAAKEKGCPKGAFLGLCEYGFIKNVPKGKYTNSEENKRYAVKAIRLLINNPQLLTDEEAVWKEVIGEQIKKQNNQIDLTPFFSPVLKLVLSHF